MRPDRHRLLHGPVAVTAAIGLAALAGCAGETASIGAAFVPVLDQPPEPIHALEVLFVIDDSASMQDQQDALIASAQQALFDQLATQTDGLPDLRRWMRTKARLHGHESGLPWWDHIAPLPVAAPELGTLDPDAFLAALKRGSRMTVDLFDDWDYWAVVGEPVTTLRERYGITST